MVRARLNCTELSEIAFRSSPGSTRLGITACMAGANSALAVPATIEIAMMCQTAMCPLAVSRARVSAVGATLAGSAYVMPGLSEEYVVGAEFLERYNIWLDPKRGRLVLPPRRRLALILV